MINKSRLLGFALGIMAAWPVYAQETDEGNTTSDAVSLNYVGDEIRIGIGYDSETDLTGEFFWAFSEQPDSAWLAEGWMGNGSSGGLKLNYHWLSGGVESGQDLDGNPVYSDGRVRKLFLAADRNIYDDAKLTFGGGSEHNNKFWSLYASKSITGRRYLGQTIGYTAAKFDRSLLTFGLMALFGVILGSFLWSLVTKSFRIEWFSSVRDFINHARL